MSNSNEHRRFTILLGSEDDTIEGSEMTEENCVVCQKAIGTDVKRAPRKPNLAESLNGIWHYVEALKRNFDIDGDSVDDGEDGIDLSRIFGTQNMENRTFVKTPCICLPCADKVQVLSDTVDFLKTKLKELRKIVVESKKNDKPLDAAAVVHEALVAAFLRNGSTTANTNVQSTSTSGNVSTAPVCTQTSRKDLFNKPPESIPDPDISEQDDDFKIENPETEMMEWDTLENFKSEDPLAPLYKEETSSVADDQSWKGSDTEDITTPSDADTNIKDRSPSSAAEDEVNSSEEEEDAILESKRNYATRIKKSDEKMPRDKHRQPKEFNCDVAGCQKSFPTKPGLQCHRKRSHPTEYPAKKKYPCTCGKVFNSTDYRSLHFRTSAEHKGEKSDFFGKNGIACDMCGVKQTLDKLEAHVRAHVGDYAVKCPNANCGYIFTSVVAVSPHLTRNKSCRKVVDKKGLEHSCETCGFKTYQRRELRNHLKLYHERDTGNRKLHCPIPTCTEMFCVRESVQFHLGDMHKMKPQQVQKCVECSQEIKIEEMEQHLKLSHQATQIIQCQHCPFMFSSTSRESFVDHLYAHRGNVEALVCDICNDGVKFGRHGGLRDHYYSAHQIGKKEYICEECGKAFFQKTNFKVHKMYHAGRLRYNQKIFRCDICPESIQFNFEATLISHKISVHGAEPFRCQICGETFSSNATFLKHERAHMEIHRKTYKCGVKECGKIFKDKKSLVRHTISVHGGDDAKKVMPVRRHDCDTCGKLYPTSYELKKHVDITHLKLRPFVCDQCGNCYGSTQDLKRHNLIHTGERQFECTICNKGFRHKIVLKKHMDGHEKKGDSFKPRKPRKTTQKRASK